jgi:hypothetical protein
MLHSDFEARAGAAATSQQPAISSQIPSIRAAPGLGPDIRFPIADIRFSFVSVAESLY